MVAKKVMLVEDEVLVALDIEDIIGQAGFDVDGPYMTVSETLRAVSDSQPDCAILDVQLRDGEVYPAADILRDAGVPIIFHSGHADSAGLTERYPDAVICGKPCNPVNLQSALERICSFRSE